DLAAALRVARARGIAVRIRAGGHSYIGASTVSGGVVLDLRRLRGIELMADGSVLAGAGLRQIELIGSLARRGRAVVHGSCPTVGVAGFTLGGGYGLDSRRYGLACDTLLAARVIDLRTLKPAAADADLLAGLRGAGASLAPVTALRLRTHPVGAVTTFFARFPWSRAAEIVHAFSARCASAPAPLAAICSLSTGRGSAAVQVFGQYLGTGTAATRAIAALLPTGAARLSQNMHSYLDAQLIFAGCLGRTLAQCSPRSEGGTLGHDTFAAGSAYLAHALTNAQAGSVAAVIAARQAAGRSGVLLLDAQGGAIDDEPPSRTSFVHRELRSSVQILSYESAARVQAFVDSARAVLAPLGNGHAYQNYPDANLTSWRTAYYGTKYADLVALKHERDPYGLLRFPQAIGS
ncbi:MAG: hypothetical protein QOD37_962, partial [Gaiellales bacterium]|nr:hypothetical protein [Gaiellales bacterium]